MSMEKNFSQVGEYPWSPQTPEYHSGPEEHELEREPSYHYINHYYEYGSPEYSQGSEQTVNQPNTNNTRFGLGKILTMNKDEVEEDPSEDEGTEAFATEGTEAFEDKGTEAFVEKGTDALQRKVQSAAQADQGQEGNFEHFMQKLIKIKFEMPTQEMLKHNPCCMQMLQNLVKLKTPPIAGEWISLAED
jgi:hypothetical protein